MIRIPQKAHYHESMRDLLVASATPLVKEVPRDGDFDKIVALDNIYHPSRPEFFRDAATMLPEDGTVGVTEFILKDLNPPAWIRAALWLMNVRAPLTKTGTRKCCATFVWATSSSFNCWSRMSSARDRQKAHRLLLRAS